MVEFELTGPRGDNPLGFLTALGALVTLEDAGWKARLGWRGLAPHLSVEQQGSLQPGDKAGQECWNVLLSTLHSTLRRTPSKQADKTREARQRMTAAKKALKEKNQEIRQRRLSREEYAEARDREVRPLETALEEARQHFRRAWPDSAVDPTVSLGMSLTESNGNFSAHIDAAVRCAITSDRRWVDLVAAYGVADPTKRQERMSATPWALISGSGHQHFLESVQQLMVKCTIEQFRKALLGPWMAQDEMYSLRLDVDEDRRYALMDQDPSPVRPRTLWGANRLAFEALRLFPASPSRTGMAVRAWQLGRGTWLEGCAVRWPLWGPPISAAVVGSLLGLSELWRADAAARERLRALGVFAVYESRRVAVGEGGNVKYNLTPPVAIWRS